MKKLLSVLFVAMLLLSSCGKAAPQPPAPPQPVYGTAPAVSEKKASINGTVLPLYGEGYVDVAAFSAAVGREFAVNAGIETHTAEMIHEISPICFTTAAQCPTGSCNYYLTNGIYDGERWYQPLAELIPFFGYHPYTDEQSGVTYYTAYPLAEEVEAGYRVPTLMYHAVSDDCWGIRELFVSPAEMEKQLKYLSENGYTTVTFEDMGRIDEIQKPVMLTFDDGYRDNYTELFPLLKKYNAKATIFLIAEFTNREKYLTEEQIREMKQSGLVSFQGHTSSHSDLDKCNAEQLQYELVASKRALAKLTGKEPFVVAYPSGKYSEASLAVTREHYQFGLRSRGGMYTTGTDRVLLPRYYVSRYTDLGGFKNLLG